MKHERIAAEIVKMLVIDDSGDDREILVRIHGMLDDPTSVIAAKLLSEYGPVEELYTVVKDYRDGLDPDSQRFKELTDLLRRTKSDLPSFDDVRGIMGTGTIKERT